MKKMTASLSIIALLLSSTLFSSVVILGEKNHQITSVGSDQYGNGYRYNIQGWIYLHIEGDPYERGFQHGYLLSAEIVDMINRWSNTIHNYLDQKLISPQLSKVHYKKVSQLWWNFCVSKCYRMYRDKFPEEYRLEMQGIADGVTSNGGQIHRRDVTYKDILALNEMYEFISKLECIPKGIHPLQTFLYQLKTIVPELSTLDESTFIDSFLDQSPPHHCSGFVATGDATTNGQIVISDSMWCGPGSWWWTYYISLRWNIILDINPTEGHRVIMASSPGFIWSDHDFYQNDAGIVLIETTVPQGMFDNIGLPLSVRARNALQYGESIDDVIYHLRYRNDGGMNAVWLVGDTKTGEIARFELGYRRYHVKRTFNGFYWSANNPENTAVRLEKIDWKTLLRKFISQLLFDSPGFGYHSIFYRPESRDIKFEELGNMYYGKIDAGVVKKIMSTSPIADWNTDCKITDSYLVERNGMWAFFGNSEGKILNLSNINDPTETTEQIHPTGWVRIFGLPSKGNFTLVKQNCDYEEQTDIVWEFDSKSNRNDFSASCISDNDTIYASILPGLLYAINIEDGTLRWSQAIGENPTAPVTHEDLVFIGHSDGLSVFDSDGSSGWWISGADVVSDPVVCNDVVIFGDKNGDVYSYSLDNREEQWTLSFLDEARISSENDDCIYVASGDSCYAVDVNSSDILWNFSSNGMITSTPVINDGVVYFGSWDTFVYVLNASTGDLIWMYETGWGIDTSPAVGNNMVFVGSHDNNFYALNMTDGSLEWFFTCNAGIHSSPVIFGNNVFFGSDDGRLYSVNASTGNVNWFFAPSFTIDDDVYNYVTTPFLSSPVVNDGILYIGANGFVYALSIS